MDISSMVPCRSLGSRQSSCHRTIIYIHFGECDLQTFEIMSMYPFGAILIEPEEVCWWVFLEYMSIHSQMISNGDASSIHQRIYEINHLRKKKGIQMKAYIFPQLIFAYFAFETYIYIHTIMYTYTYSIHFAYPSPESRVPFCTICNMLYFGIQPCSMESVSYSSSCAIY